VRCTQLPPPTEFEIDRFSLLQIISKKWGFTDVNKEEYLSLKANKQCIADGSYVQYIKPKGPLLANLKNQERAL